MDPPRRFFRVDPLRTLMNALSHSPLRVTLQMYSAVACNSRSGSTLRKIRCFATSAKRATSTTLAISFSAATSFTNRAWCEGSQKQATLLIPPLPLAQPHPRTPRLFVQIRRLLVEGKQECSQCNTFLPFWSVKDFLVPNFMSSMGELQSDTMVRTSATSSQVQPSQLPKAEEVRLLGPGRRVRGELVRDGALQRQQRARLLEALAEKKPILGFPERQTRGDHRREDCPCRTSGTEFKDVSDQVYYCQHCERTELVKVEDYNTISYMGDMDHPMHTVHFTGDGFNLSDVRL